MEKLYVIKIGGNIVDDERKLDQFLTQFSRIDAFKILVHGGGKLATRLADDLKIPQQMVEGRRITDAETLKIVTMVYAGLINKGIVARLAAAGTAAIGLTGADGNAILAEKRNHPTIDYGYAGDVRKINSSLLLSLLRNQLVPVIAPITHDGKGQLLNTNADTIAQETAKALSGLMQVHLIYSFEKAGVLLDAEDENTVIPKMDASTYLRLKEEKKVFAGMIPKLDNAFEALSAGVSSVVIGKAEELPKLITGEKGTTIANE